MRIAPLAPVAALLLAGCEVVPSLVHRPAVCAATPVARVASSTFTLAGDASGWRTESGQLAQASELVTCRGASAARAHVTGTALAEPYADAPGAPAKLAELGGSYWTGPYPNPGRCHLDTSGPNGLVASGTVLSPPLAAERFVGVRVGGGGDARTWVELCDASTSACEPIAGTRRGGPGILGMERVAWDLGPAGRSVRLRVGVDAKQPATRGEGFLLVDDLVTGATAPTAEPARLWGFVDLHAHLFGDIGSGARTLHGKIFFDDDGKLSRRDRMERALGRTCEADHGIGGHTFSTEPLFHGTRGFPDFEDWPHYDSIAHQQAYVDWIERAYRGGLRLVQMDVGNNTTYAAAYEQLNGGVVPPLPQANREPGDGVFAKNADEDVVRHKELAAMRRLVGPGGPAHAWADIAYSSAEARRIALEGKLVLVPGVENDNPGVQDEALLGRASALPEDLARPIVRAYVERIYAEGIRHVFPVHVMKNVFGSPVVFDRTIYCASLPEEGDLPFLQDGWDVGIRYHVNRDPGRTWFTDFLSTSILDPLPHPPAVDANAGQGSFARSDCYKWNFPTIPGAKPLDRSLLHVGTAHHLRSTRSRDGLTPVGELFVREAMRLGMIVDLTHMSEVARGRTIEIADELGHYPLMASHVNFRELAFGNANPPAPKSACDLRPTNEEFKGDLTKLERAYGTEQITKVGYEYALRRDEIETVRRLGGMVGIAGEISGVGVEATPACEPGAPCPKTTPIDCDGTSKSFAQPYRYVRGLMRGKNIGLGTDVNGFYMLPSPRFSPNPQDEGNACGGAKGDRLRWIDGHKGPGNQPQGDATRVRYDVARDAASMRRYRVPGGGKAFDVNTDGVAHYGLLPDFLQDVVNVGVSPEELASLFSGLEDYLEMWARCEAIGAELRKSP